MLCLSIQPFLESMLSFFAFDFSIKFIKSVASLRCDFVILILAVAMYLYQQKKGKFFPLGHLMIHKFKEITS